jgi:hypothetical protein
MESMSRSALTVLFPMLLASSSLAGNVLVVGRGTSPFTDIASAIAASHDGDVVLVKAGTYAGFTISNQGVTVIADANQLVQVNGTVRVVQLAAQRDVLLSGMQVIAGSAYHGLELQGNVGSVRVQACHLQGDRHANGALIQNSSDVALTSVGLFGGDGIPNLLSMDPHANGGIGLMADTSQIALYDSTATGGSGAATDCFGGSGGDGLQVVNTYLFAADSLINGGSGANAQNHCYSNCEYCVCGGGNGGNGVTLDPAGTGSATRFDSFMNVLQRGWYGAGATNVQGCCGLATYCDGDSGDPGQALAVGAGDTYNPLAGTQPRLSAAPNPVRENSSVTLTFSGHPGDFVYLLMSAETSFQLSPFKGVLLVPHSSPPLIGMFGPLDATGSLQVSVPIGELGAGVQSRVMHMQSFHKNAGGHYVLGNPVHLVMLDQAF